MSKSIIVIGAGAAGLMAATELAVSGQAVTVLEAAERSGGRIYTAICDGFEQPLELGAEFIHGKLPITLGLLKEAGIPYTPVKGVMLNNQNGKWSSRDEIIPDWDGIIEKMDSLETDMTLAEFFQQYYNGDEHIALRASIQGFAEGFDLADITQASVFALRSEWEKEEETQYRITGGYRKIVEYLAHVIEKHGGKICHKAAVKIIKWKRAHVEIVTTDGCQYEADKAIITISPRLLETVKIQFEPTIDSYLHAFSGIGFGSVIKIFFEFEEPFWQKHEPNTAFVISDQNIPTWWTQSNKNNYILTGWLGGPRVVPLATATEEEIIALGLLSLASIYGIPVKELRSILVASKAVNWSNEQWSMGGYSFDTLQTANARKILNEPVENTLFFAGEALYSGEAPGTVEAALISGRSAAQKILSL